jgi:hypothetical protein
MKLCQKKAGTSAISRRKYEKNFTASEPSRASKRKRETKHPEESTEEVVEEIEEELKRLKCLKKLKLTEKKMLKRVVNLLKIQQRRLIVNLCLSHCRKKEKSLHLLKN